MPRLPRFPLFLTSLALATVPLASHASSRKTCPIDHAHYTYSAGDGEAEFSIIPGLEGFLSRVSLHIRIQGQNDFWFLFDSGSARYVSLVSITDPRAPGWKAPDGDGGDRPLRTHQTYVAWDANLKIREALPQAGDSAPGFVLLPDLAEGLWYGVQNDRRIGIAAGIFKLDSCRP